VARRCGTAAALTCISCTGFSEPRSRIRGLVYAKEIYSFEGRVYTGLFVTAAARFPHSCPGEWLDSPRYAPLRLVITSSLGSPGTEGTATRSWADSLMTWICAAGRPIASETTSDGHALGSQVFMVPFYKSMPSTRPCCSRNSSRRRTTRTKRGMGRTKMWVNVPDSPHRSCVTVMAWPRREAWSKSLLYK